MGGCVMARLGAQTTDPQARWRHGLGVPHGSGAPRGSGVPDGSGVRRGSGVPHDSGARPVRFPRGSASPPGLGFPHAAGSSRRSGDCRVGRRGFASLVDEASILKIARSGYELARSVAVC
jgi:hypothetical protein